MVKQTDEKAKRKNVHTVPHRITDLLINLNIIDDYFCI